MAGEEKGIAKVVTVLEAAIDKDTAGNYHNIQVDEAQLQENLGDRGEVQHVLSELDKEHDKVKGMVAELTGMETRIGDLLGQLNNHAETARDTAGANGGMSDEWKPKVDAQADTDEGLSVTVRAQTAEVATRLGTVQEAMGSLVTTAATKGGEVQSTFRTGFEGMQALQGAFETGLDDIRTAVAGGGEAAGATATSTTAAMDSMAKLSQILRK